MKINVKPYVGGVHTWKDIKKEENIFRIWKEEFVLKINNETKKKEIFSKLFLNLIAIKEKGVLSFVYNIHKHMRMIYCIITVLLSLICLHLALLFHLTSFFLIIYL